MKIVMREETCRGKLMLTAIIVKGGRVMEFELTAEQLELREWAHGFAEKEIRPVAAYYDEHEEMP